MKSIIVILTLSVAFFGRALAINDSTSTFEIKATKPSNPLQIHFGTGYGHLYELGHLSERQSPILQGNVQYFLSRRWSVGVVMSFVKLHYLMRHNDDLYTRITSFSYGFKSDYAFVSRKRFEAYLSVNISNYRDTWESMRITGGTHSPYSPAEKYNVLTPSGGIGVKWFPTEHLGVYGEVGYGYCLAQTGLSFRL